MPLKKKSTKKVENKEKPFENGVSHFQKVFSDSVYPATCHLWYTSSMQIFTDPMSLGVFLQVREGIQVFL